MTWKHSFLSVMEDINANSLEQLDLLLNNLEQVCKGQCEKSDLRTHATQRGRLHRSRIDWTWTMAVRRPLNMLRSTVKGRLWKLNVLSFILKHPITKRTHRFLI